jgi:hypothetical protein
MEEGIGPRLLLYVHSPAVRTGLAASPLIRPITLRQHDEDDAEDCPSLHRIDGELRSSRAADIGGSRWRETGTYAVGSEHGQPANSIWKHTFSTAG